MQHFNATINSLLLTKRRILCHTSGVQILGHKSRLRRQRRHSRRRFEMTKKHRRRSSNWGMKKRPAKVGAPATRRAEMEGARAKYPSLFKKIQRIKERAKVLTSPRPYGINDYLVELFEMVYEWSMIRRFMLRTVAKQYGRKIKAGTNPLVLLINVTADFTKQRASRLAGKLARGFNDQLTPKQFKARLWNEGRSPSG
jgi:hypothetical protein